MKCVFQLKSRIREQQNEREKEQNDHALMLRELQKLLAEERSKLEVVENKVSCKVHVLLWSDLIFENCTSLFWTSPICNIVHIMQIYMFITR